MVAENIKVVSVPTNLFLSSPTNEPYLIEYHKNFLLHLLRFKTALSLNLEENQKMISIKKYWHYFEILLQKPPKLSELELIQSKFYDIPQTPLQPCSQNLTLDTYLAFEKDLVKYDLYYFAFLKFLKDWVEKNGIQERLSILFIG